MKNRIDIKALILLKQTARFQTLKKEIFLDGDPIKKDITSFTEEEILNLFTKGILLTILYSAKS